MSKSLRDYVDTVARYNARASFPVTASALRRHPSIFRELVKRYPSVELAVHGHLHTDLSLLPAAEQAAEIESAIALFRAHGIPFTGFRAPYLRWDDHLMEAIGAAGFWHDSSQCLLWPVLEDDALTAKQNECVEILCEFCQPRSAEDYPALPFWIGDLLEIPVSLPDDELLVERLRLTDVEQMAAIWTKALHQSHAREELFVLQLHPERFPLCARALERVLQSAQSLPLPVWAASLHDIAVWWRQKRDLQLDLVSVGGGQWEIGGEGPERGTLLVRDAEPSVEATPWKENYRLVTQPRFRVNSDRCPCLGISPSAPIELLHFLTDQGYVVEVSDEPDNYTFHLDRTEFARADALSILREVEAAPGPLVRWARWPLGAGSAMAITGDVDAVTFWDYLLRPFER
jgi:peptidoglycan/xylan/chitin deacetylase (PgdA/CDA1 family)